MHLCKYGLEDWSTFAFQKDIKISFFHQTKCDVCITYLFVIGCNDNATA